ncbi:MAG: TIGR04255 family protein [Halioglobus sp.]
MRNHIATKFFGLVYAQIPSNVFQEKITALTEELRPILPRYDSPSVTGIRVNVNDGAIATQQEHQGLELHMVDAKGLWGVKIGNVGIGFSTASYVDYDECVDFIAPVMEKVSASLSISHFSQVSLRNINLFDHKPDDDNQFIDIKDNTYWGRQSFQTLTGDFSCSGASTRHEYLSTDCYSAINVASSVVLKNRTHIPQDEWDIWKLRGGVPVQDKKNAQLMIDISGIEFQAPRNRPDLQNNVTEYSWNAVEGAFSKLRGFVNSVYSDITVE